jgi:hypothetical protein
MKIATDAAYFRRGTSIAEGIDMTDRAHLLVPLLIAAACGTPVADDGEAGIGSDSAEVVSRIATSVTLLNEGSCSFLACASSYSDSVSCRSEGAVQCRNGCKSVHFGCSQAGTCTEGAIWIVRPRSARVSCGQALRVCYNGTNAIAEVWDTSDANNHWEASEGLQQALDMPIGHNGRVNIYDADDNSYQRDARCN